MTHERRARNRLLVGSALLALMLAIPLAIGGDAIVMVKKAYANGGGAGSGGGGSGGGGGGSGGGGGGSGGGSSGGSSGGGSSGGGSSGGGSAAGGGSSGDAAASGGAVAGAVASGPGGAAYTPELSAIDAFLRSPGATYPLAGQHSTVSVQSVFVDRLGQTCRIVEQTVIIAGEKTKASGTMCLQPDGRWALVPEGQR